jgi:hypothetical protein
VAKALQKQLRRLQSRAIAHDELVKKKTPAQAAAFKRPGSMNAHKGTAVRGRR